MTHDEIQKPLGCPFCGAEPEEVGRADLHTGTGKYHAFACMCGGYSANAHQFGETRDEALTKWNRRAQLEARPAVEDAPSKDDCFDGGKCGVGGYCEHCYQPITPTSPAVEAVSELDLFDKHAEAIVSAAKLKGWGMKDDSDFSESVQGVIGDVRRALSHTATPAAEGVSEWLPLSEFKPEPECYVLTWNGKVVGVDWWGGVRYRRGDSTTHWLPFTKPPGAGQMYGMHSIPAAPLPKPLEPQP